MVAKHREALKEEWDIFRFLFSEELIQKVTNNSLPQDEQRNITLALNALGFEAISDEIIRNSPMPLSSETQEKGIPEINIKKVSKICSLFIDEIKSPNLKKVFDLSVQYHLYDYEELNRYRKS